MFVCIYTVLCNIVTHELLYDATEAFLDYRRRHVFTHTYKLPIERSILYSQKLKLVGILKG